RSFRERREELRRGADHTGRHRIADRLDGGSGGWDRLRLRGRLLVFGDIGIAARGEDRDESESDEIRLLHDVLPVPLFVTPSVQTSRTAAGACATRREKSDTPGRAKPTRSSSRSDRARQSASLRESDDQAVGGRPYKRETTATRKLRWIV